MEGTELGGTEQSSLQLMKGLQNYGHELIVFSLTPIGALKKELDKSNIKVYGFDVRFYNYFKVLYLLKKKIKSINPDYLIMTGGNLVSLLSISKSLSKNSYLAIHFHHYVDNHKILRWLRWRIFYNLANYKFAFITFASEFIREEAISIYPKITSKSYTVNNPILPKPIKTKDEILSSRAALGIPEHSLVIGNAGWLIKRKRFDILLNVAYELKKEHKNLVVLIAGDGEERSSLEKMVNTFGLKENVVWLGWQKNLNHFYNSIDFLIFSSEIDAVGLTPLEAIIKGTVSFCSVKKGGLKDILKKDYSYFIISEHDIKILVNKINFSLENQKEINDLLLRCRKYILQVSNSDFISHKINRMITYQDD